MKKEFKITGMTCSACSSHVKRAVEKVEDVKDVNVNLLTNSMTCTITQEKTVFLIIKAVQNAGYGAIEKNNDTNDGEEKS